MVQILDKYGNSSIDNGKVVVLDKYGKVKSFSSGGGSGTVTSFSSGNLSPLFNTSVATPTTTPALSFSQISQAQNLFFASPNGSSGVPTFRAIVAADLPSLSSTYVPVTRNITINGTTFDLSADRTWNVGIVTSLSAGTGISIGGTSAIPIVTNTAPDQTVVLTAGTGISITGTYPSFTITNSSPSSGGTVTSVAALTLGTTGTDLNSSVANSTTTPVITLNVPTASATNRGALSSTDWSTFNSKQNAVIIIEDLTTYTSVAGTTTEQIMSNNTLSANSLKANSIVRLSSRFRRPVAGNTGTVKFYISTVSNNISPGNATQIGTYGGGLNVSPGVFTRDFAIDGSGTLTGYPAATSAVTDSTTYNTITADLSLSLTLSNTYYLISTITTSGTGTLEQKTLLLTSFQ